MTMTCRMLQVVLLSLSPSLPPNLSQQMMMLAILYYEDLPHAASGRQRQRQRQGELEDQELTESCTQRLENKEKSRAAILHVPESDMQGGHRVILDVILSFLQVTSYNSLLDIVS